MFSIQDGDNEQKKKESLFATSLLGQNLKKNNVEFNLGTEKEADSIKKVKLQKIDFRRDERLR
jgi:hypothetical protein